MLRSLGCRVLGPCFSTSTPSPPLLRASWRLQLTSIVLFPFFVYQLATIEHEVAEQFRTRRTWSLLLASGVALALSLIHI